MQTLPTWLTPELVGSCIGNIILGLALLLTWYRGRIRPSKIVVFEANRTLFTKLPAAERRLFMTFNGEEIENLTMIDLTVRNEGASTIEDIDFTIEVNEQAEILTVEPRFAPPGVTVDCEAAPRSIRRVISISHLNPLSLAKEQVRLVMFCEPEPDAVHIRGGGKGWSLEFLGQPELEARKAKRERVRNLMVIPIMAAMMAWLVGLIAFGIFLEDRFFPRATRDWWQVVPLVASVLGVMFGGFFAILRIFDPIMKRLSKPYPD